MRTTFAVGVAHYVHITGGVSTMFAVLGVMGVMICIAQDFRDLLAKDSPLSK